MAILKIQNIEYHIECEISKSNNFANYEHATAITKQFTLEVDNHLQELFNLNLVQSNQEKMLATLEVANKTFQGYVRINGIKYSGLLADELTLTFIENLGLFDVLKTKKCNEISTLNYFNNWYRTNDVLNAMQGTIDGTLPNTCYTYAILNYEERPVKKQRVFNTFYNSCDFVPVLKVPYLVESIFRDAGYGVQYNLGDAKPYYDKLVSNSTKLNTYELYNFDYERNANILLSGAVVEYPNVSHHPDFVNNNSFKIGRTVDQVIPIQGTQSSTPVYFNDTIRFNADSGTNSLTSFRNTLGQSIGLYGSPVNALRFNTSNHRLYSGYDVVNQSIYLNVDIYIPNYVKATTNTIKPDHVYLHVIKNKGGVNKVVRRYQLFEANINTSGAYDLNTNNASYFSYAGGNDSYDYHITGTLAIDLSATFNFNDGQFEEFLHQPLTHDYSAQEEYLYFTIDCTFDRAGVTPYVPNPVISKKTFFYNSVIPAYREGTIMNIAADLAPTIEQSTYIKNVLEMLNLKIDIDQENKFVTLSHHDEFYKDWIDISDFFSFEDLNMEYTHQSAFNKFIFTPKNLDTPVDKLYKSSSGTEFGYAEFSLSDTKLNEEKMELDITYEIPLLVQNDSGYNFIISNSNTDEKVTFGLAGTHSLSNSNRLIYLTNSIWNAGLNDGSYGSPVYLNYYPTYLPFDKNTQPERSLLFDPKYYLSYPIDDSKLNTYLNSIHINKLNNIVNTSSKKLTVDCKINENNKALYDIVNGKFNTVYIRQLMNYYYVDKWIYSDQNKILRLELIQKI